MRLFDRIFNLCVFNTKEFHHPKVGLPLQNEDVATFPESGNAA